jgi:4-carboxymuconolactone decarboxylase
MTQRRFEELDIADMTEAQKKAREGIVSGPRAGMRGPFNALLRSPDLADRVQRVGEYVRFRSSLPAALSELAILVTARYWTAQFEWYAHAILAQKAGLDPKVAADIAENRRPSGMSPDEEIVYDFCHALHHDKGVGDAVFARTRERFGEQGVIDLIGACGYYTMVSMVLNVDRHPLPEGVAPPLKQQ